MEVILGFSLGTRSPRAKARGSTAEAALFFARDGRPADGGGGSFDLSPCPGGEVERCGSWRLLRKA
jgi:hypothetical protein